MKNIVTTSLLMLSSLFIFSQYFEGKITYINTYISNNPLITNEQWSMMMGDTQDYYIKDGDYKSISNGTKMEWLLYINHENKLYNKMTTSEIIFWSDGLSNSDSIIRIERKKETINIMGYMCDELIFVCKNGIQKYYFNASLKVNEELFKNHNFGNWYSFVKKSKALPLKIIIETPQFTLQSVAIKVENSTLKKSFFQLPPNAVTKQTQF